MDRVGLVAPLPPQVGGVASVAEWLLAHEEQLGVRYETFDLRRPGKGVGGRWSIRAGFRQAAMLGRFASWVRRAPRVLHICVSATATGLARDVALLLVARVTGRVIVAHVHGSDLNEAIHSPFRRLALRLVGRLSTECVGLSPSSAAALASAGIDARWISNPVRVEPNGLSRLEEKGPLRLLLVGRYGERKGCFDLIDALARVRSDGLDVKLSFVGSEEHPGEEERLREAVHRQGLEEAVAFVGVVGPDVLAAQYASADVLCLPSRREGLPMVVLEGMAFGLPVIATPVGGISDLVDDGRSGVLVTPGDIGALAHAIRELADTDRRGTMGAAAKERVRVFADPNAIAAGWREVYAAADGQES
jgi:glycosyltransferase involved in cell wall biosynthesis